MSVGSLSGSAPVDYTQIQEDSPNIGQKIKGKLSECWQSMNNEVFEVFGDSKVRIVKQKSWSEWQTLGNWMSSPSKMVSKKNEFINTNWSPQYFGKVSDDLRSMKASTYSVLIDMGKTLSSTAQLLLSVFTLDGAGLQLHGKELITNFCDLLKDTLCFAVMLGQSALNYAINVDGLNLIKGVVGIIYSTIHTVGSLAMVAYSLASGDCKAAKEHAWEALKDLFIILACTGHSIPSWAPFAMTLLFPPAAIPLLIAKIGKKCVGLPDLVGYGATLLLLWADMKGETDPSKKKELQKQWDEMVEKIHPAKSMEGKVLAVALANMAAEATDSVVSLVAGEHAGKIAKYGVLGLGTIGALSAGFLCKKDPAKTTEEVAHPVIEKLHQPAPTQRANQVAQDLLQEAI